MAVDLNIIFEHHLNIDEIMELPEKLEADQQLRKIFKEEAQSKYDYGYSEQKFKEKLLIKHKWKKKAKEYILRSWENNEKTSNCYDCYTIELYFGWIYFNRFTLELRYCPEYHYRCLLDMSHRNFIFKFSNALAQFLNSKKIIYYSDSFVTDYIGSWASEGLKFDDILELAILHFGEPPTSLDEALENRFFIDDILSSHFYLKELKREPDLRKEPKLLIDIVELRRLF